MKSLNQEGRKAAMTLGDEGLASKLLELSTKQDFTAMINWNALRKEWLGAAKQTSVGILLFSFTAPAWTFPETLGSIIARHPALRSRFRRWVNQKPATFPNVLVGESLAYMLRGYYPPKRRAAKRTPSTMRSR